VIEIYFHDAHTVPIRIEHFLSGLVSDFSYDMSCFLKLSKQMTNRYGSWRFCYMRASEIALNCYYRQVIWHVCYTYGHCLTICNRHTVLPSV